MEGNQPVQLSPLNMNNLLELNDGDLDEYLQRFKHISPIGKAFIRVMLYIFEVERGTQVYLWPMRIAKLYYYITGQYLPGARPQSKYVFTPPVLSEIAYYLERLADLFEFKVIARRKRKHVVIIDLYRLRMLTKKELLDTLLAITSF